MLLEVKRGRADPLWRMSPGKGLDGNRAPSVGTRHDRTLTLHLVPVPLGPGSNRARDGALVVATALKMLVEPFAMLWFIQMLAVYFLVTRLTRRVPVWLMLSLTAALQLTNVWSDWSQLRHFGERYVYFYAGYAFAPAFFALAELARRRRRLALLGLLCWSVINGVLVHNLAAATGVSLMSDSPGRAQSSPCRASCEACHGQTGCVTSASIRSSSTSASTFRCRRRRC